MNDQKIKTKMNKNEQKKKKLTYVLDLKSF